MMKRPRFAASTIAALCLIATGCSNPEQEESGSEPNTETAVSQPANLTGDAAAGKIAFNQCLSCHSVEQDQHLMGPSLAGIVGAPAGKSVGFNHSPGSTNSNIIWTQANLNKFLEKPRSVIPGTMMAFPGVPDPQDRADIIAYLKAPE